MEIIDWTEKGMNKVVLQPLKSFQRDYIRQTEFLKDAQTQIKVNQDKMASNTLYTCTNRDAGDKDSAMYFVPIFVGDFNQSGQSTMFTEGTCFQKLQFTYDYVVDADGNMGNVTLTIDASRPKSLLCKDWFLIANTDV